jgi:deoxyribose-phosphate aldolase
VAARLLPLLDLTSLNDNDDAAMIAALADAARTAYGDVAVVCTWPRLVTFAADALLHAPVGVAAVANFPSGEGAIDDVVAEICLSIEAGATEIDVVIPFRALIAGDHQSVLELVQASRAACGPDVALKTILESGQLETPPLIRRASELAIEGGSDFLKTSTGKSRPGATLSAARAMIEAIVASGRPIGFKASGGVRTLEQARAYLTLFEEIIGPGAATPDRFRIGASALLQDVLAALGG